MKTYYTIVKAILVKGEPLEYTPYLHDELYDETNGYESDAEPYWELDRAKLDMIAQEEMNKYKGLDLLVIPVNIDI